LNNHLQNSENILVSIIVCSRNEKEFIQKCINSLTNQTGIHNELEILVIDGMSEDNTREIVSRLAENDNRIFLMENRDKVKPPAVNIGFRKARGKFLAICDAHSVYDKNYISILLELMEEHPEAHCVGGPILSQGNNSFGKATAIAMSSLVGVGNAKHRFPDYQGYAEMASFPLFRREVLDMIGYYDETLIHNHDDEYCFRLNRAGGKVYISPKAKSTYYVRNSPKSLFKQYFGYGYWKVIVLRKHKLPISYRQFAPVIFYLFVGILLIISILLKNIYIGLLLPIIYLMIITSYSLIHLKKNNIKIVLLLIFSIIILHLSYACGFIAGFFKSTFSKNKNN